MDSFEFNKIAASVLVALLVVMIGSLVSESLVHSQKLQNNILGIVAGTSTGDAATEKKALGPITPLLVSADITKGKEIAKKCTQCHTFEENGAQKIGPNLWGIVGNKIAHVADFAYSAVFKAKEGKWDVEELNKFIYKPRDYAPGTKMSFAGISDDKDRANLIAYLNTLSANPAPLPQ